MIRKGFYCKWLSTLKLNEIAADVRSSMQQLDMWLARKAVVYLGCLRLIHLETRKQVLLSKGTGKWNKKIGTVIK